MNGSEVRIVRTDNHHIPLDGNLEKYAVRPPYVIGYNGVKGLNPDTSSVPGYFILNTTTHEFKDALDENQWRDELQRIGWEHPVLMTPR